MSYNRIYVDGSILSFGNLLWAQRQTERLWAIFSHTIDSQVRKYVEAMHDVSGSLSHFERIEGREPHLVRHWSVEEPKNCICIRNAEEFFFSIICDFSENKQEEILSLTRICSRKCMDCIYCVKCEMLANKYGFYDIVEMTR